MGRFSIRRRQKQNAESAQPTRTWGFALKKKNNKQTDGEGIGATDQLVRGNDNNPASQETSPASSPTPTKSSAAPDEDGSAATSQSDSSGSSHHADAFDRLVATVEVRPSPTPGYFDDKKTIEIIQSRLEKSRIPTTRSKERLKGKRSSSKSVEEQKPSKSPEVPNSSTTSLRDEASDPAKETTKTRGKMPSCTPNLISRIRVEESLSKKRQNATTSDASPPEHNASSTQSPRELDEKEQKKALKQALKQKLTDDDQSIVSEELKLGIIDALLDFVGGAEEEDYGDEDSFETSADHTRSVGSRTSNAPKRGYACGRGVQGCGPTTWDRRNMLCGSEEVLEGDAEKLKSLPKDLMSAEQQQMFDTYFLEALWHEMRTMKASDFATAACAPIPRQKFADLETEFKRPVVESKFKREETNPGKNDLRSESILTDEESQALETKVCQPEENIHEEEVETEAQADTEEEEEDTQEPEQEQKILETAEKEAENAEEDSLSIDQDDFNKAWGPDSNSGKMSSYSREDNSWVYPDPPLENPSMASTMNSTTFSGSKVSKGGMVLSLGESVLLSPLTYRSSPSFENSVLENSVLDGTHREVGQGTNQSMNVHSQKNHSKSESFDITANESETVASFKTDLSKATTRSTLAKRAVALYGAKRAEKQKLSSAEVSPSDVQNARSRGLALVSNRKRSSKAEGLQ